MAKISLSKFGEQQLGMANYACGFNQSETGKYFEWIIIYFHLVRHSNLVEWLSCMLWFNMIYIHLNWQCLSLCSLLFSVSILTLFPPSLIRTEWPEIITYLWAPEGKYLNANEHCVAENNWERLLFAHRGLTLKLAFLAFSTPWCPIGMFYVQLLPQNTNFCKVQSRSYY